MDLLGWVVMTQVGSEEVRTSRWAPRQRSSGTTGGTSGSTSMSLKLSDSFKKSWYESSVVKLGFNFNSSRTMRGLLSFSSETHKSKAKVI